MLHLRFAALIVTALVGASPPAAAISGGHPAVDQRFGFVRLLTITTRDGSGGTCTGSLIGERHVLTAAHCVLEDDGGPVRSIMVRRSGTDRAGIPAKAALVHAGYAAKVNGPFVIRNDLAVLVLSDADPGEQAITPFEYLWRQHKRMILQPYKPTFLRELGLADTKPAIDRVLSRDEAGRPYATQIGFGLAGCTRDTGKCSRPPGTQANYIQKHIFNYRIDRPVITSWCDPGPFSLSAPGQNLICSSHMAETTLSPRTEGPSGVYGTQKGDSGGPAVVFDADKRPFVIGVNSFGSLAQMSIHMNLVEHFDFLRDIELGAGATLRSIELSRPAPPGGRGRLQRLQSRSVSLDPAGAEARR